ncbi:LysR substrate-binding domain-containing protein, partial [Pseudomonas syringae]
IGRMVANGLGVSAVPSLCIGQMQELGACCVALVEPLIERRIGLMMLADHKLSAAAQALREVLIENARNSR